LLLFEFRVVDDPIPLSALQHWHYCPRRCAVIHLKQVFDDNLHSLRRQAVHARAYKPHVKTSKHLGNGPAHALFDRLQVKPKEEGAVARSFAAYSVLFDDQSLSVGQEVQPAPGVTLTRRC